MTEPATEGAAPSGLSLVALQRQYTDYVSVKTNEVEEARTAWRYYHSAQWTEEQLRKLADRGQPAITFDRLSRKIDGLVGIVMRMRADPKAFPRTPKHEAGAELSTTVLRFVLDTNRWEYIEGECVRSGGVQGVSVLELGLEPGSEQDPDVTLSKVDPTTFFYDPRSVEPDFSDARFMGVARWVTADELDEMFPGSSEQVADSFGAGDWTAFDADRAPLWVNAQKKIRLVEHWYKHRGEWCYRIYVNTVELASGTSPFDDGRGRTICRYLPWSYQVDHDGDRYGFVRRLKGPQDAINQHRSKAMHIMNTRQVITRKDAVEDIEKTRREAARPDGVLVYDGNAEDFRIVEADQEFLQQTNYFQDAKQEIENFGPNPAVVGTGVEARSGRALAMMQQAGIAELGPFLSNYRAWKLRVYRAVWCAVRRWWSSERWIRVTDDDGLAQFIPVNQVQIGPEGAPQIVNALGQLDVDIILDEGPDTTNVMGDVFDTLSSLAQNSDAVPAPVLIELSPLPKSTKDKILKMLTQPPDPAQQQAQTLELQGRAAEVEKTRAETEKTLAQAEQIGAHTAHAVADLLTPTPPEPSPEGMHAEGGAPGMPGPAPIDALASLAPQPSPGMPGGF